MHIQLFSKSETKQSRLYRVTTRCCPPLFATLVPVESTAAKCEPTLIKSVFRVRVTDTRQSIEGEGMFRKRGTAIARRREHRSVAPERASVCKCTGGYYEHGCVLVAKTCLVLKQYATQLQQMPKHRPNA